MAHVLVAVSFLPVTCQQPGATLHLALPMCESFLFEIFNFHLQRSKLQFTLLHRNLKSRGCLGSTRSRKRILRKLHSAAAERKIRDRMLSQEVGMVLWHLIKVEAHLLLKYNVVLHKGPLWHTLSSDIKRTHIEFIYLLLVLNIIKGVGNSVNCY